MRTRYVYLGANTIEVVIDEEEVSVNILPQESVSPQPDVSQMGNFPDAGNMDVPLCAAPSDETPYTGSYPGRAKPSFVRGVKTALAAGVGTTGAMLGYVQMQLGSLSDFNWATLIPIGMGAIVAGGVYACDRALRPNAKF